MSRLRLLGQKSSNQWIWQVLVLIVIALLFFVSSSANREGFDFVGTRLIFIGNVLLASIFIGFFLLPKYYYTRRYLYFALTAFLVVILAITIEEFFLEKIFFPDSRGSAFRGYFINFMRKMPLVMLFVGVKLAWDTAIKDRQLVELKSQMAVGQLQTLKAQINPHFLFNSLNNLYSFALSGSDLTPKIILGLSDILRYMIYDCNADHVPLSKELEVLEKYVDLQELQIEERGQVKYTVHGDIGDQMVAPLLFIVFVENSFKHSTSSQSKNIVIDIAVKVDQDQVHMRCHNTHATEHNTTGLDKGVGLENVKSRLDLIYPDRHKLDITSDDQHYTVDLTINLA